MAIRSATAHTTGSAVCPVEATVIPVLEVAVAVDVRKVSAFGRVDEECRVIVEEGHPSARTRSRSTP